jgi:hypothetical protein
VLGFRCENLGFQTGPLSPATIEQAKEMPGVLDGASFVRGRTAKDSGQQYGQRATSAPVYSKLVEEGEEFVARRWNGLSKP